MFEDLLAAAGEIRTTAGDDAGRRTIEQVDHLEVVLGDRATCLRALDEDVSIFGHEALRGAGDRDHLVAPEVAAAGVVVGRSRILSGDGQDFTALGAPVRKGAGKVVSRQVGIDDGAQVVLGALQIDDFVCRATQAILLGRQPAGLNAHKLMADTRAPIDWHEQRTGLGFI